MEMIRKRGSHDFCGRNNKKGGTVSTIPPSYLKKFFRYELYERKRSYAPAPPPIFVFKPIV
jgi:hypothetical protein